MEKTEEKTEVKKLRDAVADVGGMMAWTASDDRVKVTVCVGADTFTAAEGLTVRMDIPGAADRSARRVLEQMRQLLP